MTTPISPAPLTEPRPDLLPAYLSNGVIGVRLRHIPLLTGYTVLNGFAGVHPVDLIESVNPAPYPLAGDIKINGCTLSEAPQWVRFREQAYDFSCGELTTRFDFVVDDVTANVEIVSFCSRSFPLLVVQEMTVRVDHACQLALRAGVDPSNIPGNMIDRSTATPRQAEPVCDGALRWESLGGLATCGVAYTTELSGDEDADRSRGVWDEQGPLATTYTFRARAGRRYRIRQITSMVPDEMHQDPMRQAIRMADFGRQYGTDRLREENRAAWRELWRGRVQLVGAEDRWQALADAAFYYLHASVHPSSPCSTSMFGLAQWHNYHYYRGHVMWDLESFCFPPLLLTNPDAALALLSFRSESLHAARDNARMNGYRGVQFPWEASSRTGEEAAPAGGSAAHFEHHVSLDVAFAFAQYAHATQNDDVTREHVWPVLKGVAEWIESRVVRTSRGYEIKKVTGIAEKNQEVDNNAYMNMATAVVLSEAIELASRLGTTVPHRWRSIAEGIFIPMDRTRSIIFNHDAYHPGEEKGETPEALAGFFPLTYRTDPKVERETLAYYLELAPKYVGSPMLSALLGVYAARLGNREQAAELFEEGYARFDLEPFHQASEYSPSVFPEQPQAGPMFANIGGFLMSCLYGLPGLRLGPGDPQSWCERPVVMPAGWDGVEVERIWLRGAPARLTARHGDEHAHIEIEPDD